MVMTVYPAFIERLAEISAPRPKKPCGGCTMCCHIIPVAELGLEAWTRCPHGGRGRVEPPAAGRK